MSAVTREEAVSVMKERGYNMTSEAGNGSWLGFSKTLNGIWITSHVYLEQAMMDMHGGVLKMLCELSVKKFDFRHPRFAEYENWIYLYGKVCSLIDDVVLNEDLIKRQTKASSLVFQSEAPVKKTLEDRQNEFREAIIKIGKERGYPANECKKFYEYFAAMNEGGKKMMFEIIKTKKGVFSIGGRMVTWMRNKDIFAMNNTDREEKKAVKQNIELKQTKKAVNVKTLF